ncbi:FAD-linked oxidoreductase-like protein [Ilyonectria sp. MPI-CAGE-AT-0026]|nr:FAD-linked oxidoreductase-like protein [Ilyonectria sp. MPI-CAGE-AT-0026]
MPIGITTRAIYHTANYQGSSDNANKSALSRLPTKTLLRSLVLTSLMSKEWLLRPSLAILNVVAKSKSAILNADRNPFLNRILRWTIYNHFCAGSNNAQVARSLAEVKDIGYQGVILGWAKEVVLNPVDGGVHSDNAKYGPACYQMIDEWKEGTLNTLRMLGPGDFLAVKLTGAGPISLDAMKARQPMPEALEKALDEICLETQKQGSRLWIDAEQQVLQPALDEWVIALMRRYNRRRKALVYNTIQAYLKGSRVNAERHITQAAKEGWTLGLKLVRGAYIEHEVRRLIHETKEDTDRSYDLIADMVISQKLPSGTNHVDFPPSALFLATHNAASAGKAMEIYQQRIDAGLPTTTLECGQIIGMADELSCALLDRREQCTSNSPTAMEAALGVFKFLAVGSVAECMEYLYRRAVENRGAVQRTEEMVTALKKELYRRVFN